MWIWIDLVFEKVVAVLLVGWVLALYIELSHGTNKRLRTVDQVLIYREPVQCELVHGIAILMYNLHLLHNR